MIPVDPEVQKPALRVAEFVEKNRNSMAVAEGTDPASLNRLITKRRLQKLGMALAGFPDYLQEGRVYVFGNTEARFYDSQSPEQRRKVTAATLPPMLACVLVTHGLAIPPVLEEYAREKGIPLLITPMDSSAAIYRFTEFLEIELSGVSSVHGVLMDVFGVGVLLTGESGIGKSECAVELLLRGHQLVADDVVELKNVGNKILLGGCPATIQDLLELRGIGILNVRQLFGVSAIRRGKEVDFNIHLERWIPEKTYERIGFVLEKKDLFGVEVPYITIPVAVGRNLAALVEIACRVFLMRTQGLHPQGEERWEGPSASPAHSPD